MRIALVLLLGYAAFAQDAAMPLYPRQMMVKGRKYVSASGGHYLLFQPDGKLAVFTAAGKKVWGVDQVAPQVKAQRIGVAVDGNFVAWGATDETSWSALTQDPDSRAWVDLTASGALQLVSERRGVMWSSDGKLAPAPTGTTCRPYDRWAQCVAIASPKMKIMATKAVSPSAIQVAKEIYTDMTAFLKPQFPKNKFDGFIIYITNAEPWSQINGMGPIGPDLGGNNTGDELRGGAAEDYIWITEQMICKTGIKTRGNKDNITRTFDQVIHEFGHAIEKNFDLQERVKRAHPDSDAPSEDFAWDIQHWFGAPAGDMLPAAKRLVGSIFTKQKTYSCGDYKP